MLRTWAITLLLVTCSNGASENTRATRLPDMTGEESTTVGATSTDSVTRLPTTDEDKPTTVDATSTDAPTCDDFADMLTEDIPCYCEIRSKGRLTTNGLCRRKGESKCESGLIDVAGTCAGTDAIEFTSRTKCLSQLRFKTGQCVPNEMIYLKDGKPITKGNVEASLDCASQLTINGTCVEAKHSIRTGIRSMQVVYFNFADQPVFIGSCGINERNKQETYCSTPPAWIFPNCIHALGGLGWTKAFNANGCEKNEWRDQKTQCGAHGIVVEGKGGKQSFGYEANGWIVSNVLLDGAWETYSVGPLGIMAAVPGVKKSEWLRLPRVVIVPGQWMPERLH